MPSKRGMQEGFGMIVLHHRRLVASILVCSSCLFATSSARAVRIMVYNTLRYPGSTIDPARKLAFQNIVSDIGPDMLIAVEIEDNIKAAFLFIDILEVLEPGEWTFSPFSTLGDLSVVVYFKTAVFDDLLGAVNITGDPRDSRRWHYGLDGYTSNEATFYPIGMHFKAGSTPTDAARRASTANNARNNSNTFFSPTDRWFYCGDLNLQDTTEAAYIALTGNQADNDGQAVDPLNPTLAFQPWHNNVVFRFFHTQSTRTANLGDGGATGGLDDRFDFILMSSQLMGTTGLSYIPGSFREYGNDGLHFNLAINTAPTNADVGQALADDLHIASDHLPILMDLQIPAKVSADQASLDFGTVIQGSTAELTLTVSNAAVLPDPEDLSYSFAAPAGFTAPSGSFTHTVGNPGNAHIISMDTGTLGMKSGTLVINSNDVDIPALNIAVSGDVVTAPLGDLNHNGVVDFPDVPLMVSLLLDPGSFSAEDQALADMNADTNNDGLDIPLFVNALGL